MESRLSSRDRVEGPQRPDTPEKHRERGSKSLGSAGWVGDRVLYWSRLLYLLAATASGTTEASHLSVVIDAYQVRNLGMEQGVVYGLAESSMGTSSLFRFDTSLPGWLEPVRLRGLPQGAHFAEEGILAWVYSSGADGSLEWLRPASSQRTEWKGPVLSGAEPCWNDTQIRWLTRDSHGTVGLGALDVERGEWYFDPIPESFDGPRVFFTENHAVTETERRTLWSRVDEQWRLGPLLGDLQPIASTSRFVLALGSEQKTLLAWRVSTDAEDWQVVYRSEDRYRIHATSLRGHCGHDIVDFLEIGPEGDRRVVRLDTARKASRHRSPRAGFEYWAWEGEALFTVAHREGRFWLAGERGNRSRTPPRSRSNQPSPGREPEPGPSVPSEASLETVGTRPKTAALAWLRSQLGEPLEWRGEAARLIDSYEDDQRAGWIYDAALAVVAFSAAGEFDTARQLLAGLALLQRDDGSWNFAYHPDRGQPIGEKRYVGSIAWVVMAANFYQARGGDSRFRDLAQNALGYLEKFRIDRVGEQDHGAFTMGPSNRRTISTEHNLDCYSAFLWRGLLDRNDRYLGIAADTREFVLNSLWVEGGEAGDSYFQVGFRDRSLYLDAQTWGTLALWDRVVDRQRLRAALGAAERHLRVEGRMGEVEGIVGFKDGRGLLIGPKVWGEGTEGMVMALRLLGRHEAADFYHRQTARYQTASGGVPYATENSEGWSTRPSVASTAWFFLNQLERFQNPYHPIPRVSESLEGSE